MFPFVVCTREVEIRPQHRWSSRAGSVCAAAACASFQGVAWQRNAVRLGSCRSPLKAREGQEGRREREKKKGAGGSELTSSDSSGSKVRPPGMKEGRQSGKREKSGGYSRGNLSRDVSIYFIGREGGNVTGFIERVRRVTPTGYITSYVLNMHLKIRKCSWKAGFADTALLWVMKGILQPSRVPCVALGGFQATTLGCHQPSRTGHASPCPDVTERWAGSGAFIVTNNQAAPPCQGTDFG